MDLLLDKVKVKDYGKIELLEDLDRLRRQALFLENGECNSLRGLEAREVAMTRIVIQSMRCRMAYAKGQGLVDYTPLPEDEELRGGKGFSVAKLEEWLQDHGETAYVSAFNLLNIGKGKV